MTTNEPRVAGQAGSWRFLFLTTRVRQVAPDRLALKPYWGKPAVRNFREGDGDVGIMRSPVRAITPPDTSQNSLGNQQ